jgi:hypothetical protein
MDPSRSVAATAKEGRMKKQRVNWKQEAEKAEQRYDETKRHCEELERLAQETMRQFEEMNRRMVAASPVEHRTTLQKLDALAADAGATEAERENARRAIARKKRRAA